MTRGGGGKRTSVYSIDFNKGQAEMARDAVVKAIYTVGAAAPRHTRTVAAPACVGVLGRRRRRGRAVWDGGWLWWERRGRGG
eukprot:6616687-Prymnesium_polylepis.1